MSEILWIIFGCGIGTFLLRWLPLWRARYRQRSGRTAEVLQQWLAGVGPAAIAALLVVSTWGLFIADARLVRGMMVVMALGCTAAARWVCGGGVAVPTLAGALAYGVLSYLAN